MSLKLFILFTTCVFLTYGDDVERKGNKSTCHTCLDIYRYHASQYSPVICFEENWANDCVRDKRLFTVSKCT